MPVCDLLQTMGHIEEAGLIKVATDQLQSYRFLADTRDTATEERLAKLDDPFSVFRCKGIQNCINVCPKGLNPTRAIGHIRNMLLTRAT